MMDYHDDDDDLDETMIVVMKDIMRPKMIQRW